MKEEAPLNGMALGQAISNYSTQLITLSKLSFPLNETRFRKLDLLKLPKLIILTD